MDKKEKKIDSYIKEQSHRLEKDFTNKNGKKKITTKKRNILKEYKAKRKKTILILIIIIVILSMTLMASLILKTKYTYYTESINKYPIISEEMPINEKIVVPTLTNEQAIKENNKDVIGYIEMPTIDLKMPIVQGNLNFLFDDTVIQHNASTALPGENKNGIYNLRLNKNNENLQKLKKGDLLIVTILDNVYLYEFDEIGEYKKGEKLPINKDQDTVTIEQQYSIYNFDKKNSIYFANAKRIKMTKDELSIYKRV